jgi:transposase
MSKTNEFRDRPVGQYSEAFKRQVVREIDSGRLDWNGARRKYGVGGHVTIQRWHSRYSKFARNGRLIRMINTEQQYRDQEQQERIRDLEHALADAHLQIRALDTLIDLAEETYKIPLRKNSGAKQSSGYTKSLKTVV